MKHLIKKGMLFAATSCLALCCLACIGCDTKEVQEPESTQEEATENILTLGEQSETALNIIFTNETAEEIVNIAVIPAGAEADPVFLMTDDVPVGVSEQVSVYIEPADDQALYDVVILVGKNRYTLHNIDIANWSEATIRLDGDVAYLEIILNGEPVSTLREEYDIVHPPVVDSQNTTNTGYSSGYDSGAAVTVNQGEDSCVSDVVLR